MGKWWYGLSRSQRSWYILSGLIALIVVSMVIGIVACTNVALMTLMNVGFGVMVASLLALLITSMIRFS